MDNKIYDCFIIGAGPAGMTAAIYASRSCLKVAFIEKYIPGGKLLKTLFLENYPGFLKNKGPLLAQDMLKQVLKNKVDSYQGEVIELKKEKYWKIFTEKDIFTSKTVLVSTGMVENKLNIPNEKKYYGRGVSYCAVCDGPLYKNRKVVIVGGGNSAIDEAIYLSQIASEVNIVHRRDKFKAHELSVKKLMDRKNVVFYLSYIPLEVKAEDDQVIGLLVKNLNTNEEKLVKGECIFFYVGLVPEISFLRNLELEINDFGFIKVDENMSTSIPGLYAAGDVIDKKFRQIVTAISDGAIAAAAIKNYLEYKAQ